MKEYTLKSYEECKKLTPTSIDDNTPKELFNSPIRVLEELSGVCQIYSFKLNESFFVPSEWVKEIKVDKNWDF